MIFQCLQNPARIGSEKNYTDSPFINSKIISILLSHKSFLEIILNRIKICQNHLLTNNLSQKNIKTYLMDLKSDLSNLESDKKLGIKCIEKEIKNKKVKLQNQLYIQSNVINNKSNKYFSIGNIKYFNKNNKNEEIDYFNEIEQLKILSFKIENEINKIDFEFTKKINIILSLRIVRLYQEEPFEITAQGKKHKTKVTNLMKNNLASIKVNLVSVIKTVLKNKNKQKKLGEEIKNMKLEIYNDKKKKRNKKNLFQSDMLIDQQNQSTGRKNYNNKHSSKCCSKYDNININFDEIRNKINAKVFRSLSNKSTKEKNVTFF